MVSPGEARIRFKTALEEKIQKGAPDVSPEAFSGFSAYMLNSNTFLEELQTLLKSVEDLVGIDDPNEWLDSHA
ncbi:hypothetical protein CLU79DRAFT_743331 [Phycomyces nitens]|nr:hypothetical protein CLU79DRAFT_743331 [Phycomyces nitens]